MVDHVSAIGSPTVGGVLSTIILSLFPETAHPAQLLTCIFTRLSAVVQLATHDNVQLVERLLINPVM